ncbi:hypothetical protein FACS189449_11670 [Alphaproteobacteria bacterium]|nr:hypothetical protein FACS189449_11670 [Alphaproteobacteria bacterium]
MKKLICIACAMAMMSFAAKVYSMKTIQATRSSPDGNSSILSDAVDPQCVVDKLPEIRAILQGDTAAGGPEGGIENCKPTVERFVSEGVAAFANMLDLPVRLLLLGLSWWDLPHVKLCGEDSNLIRTPDWKKSPDAINQVLRIIQTHRIPLVEYVETLERGGGAGRAKIDESSHCLYGSAD